MTSADLPTEQIARLTGHTGPINTITYSSGSGQYILSGSSDRTVNLYNPSKAPTPSRSSLPSEPLKPTKSPLVQSYTGAHSHEILGLAVASDNSRFLSAGGDKFICVWDVASARTVRKLGGSGPGSHGARVECVAYREDDGGGAVAVSGSYDATARLWDLRAQDYRPMMVLAEAKDSVDCLAVEGTEIWTGSVDGRVRGYDIRMGVLSTDVIGQPVTSLTLTRDGSSYLVSTLDSTLRLMDKPTGRLLKSYTSPNASMPYTNTTYRMRSTLACGEAVVLAGSEDGAVCAWDVMTGDMLQRVWHPQGGGDDDRPKEAASGRTGARKVVSAVAWRKKGARGDGEWASAGADGTIAIWGRSSAA